jgi:hypothetical protein
MVQASLGSELEEQVRRSTSQPRWKLGRVRVRQGSSPPMLMLVQELVQQDSNQPKWKPVLVRVRQGSSQPSGSRLGREQEQRESSQPIWW